VWCCDQHDDRERQTRTAGTYVFISRVIETSKRSPAFAKMMTIRGSLPSRSDSRKNRSR
jgi:hypothetical protein